MPSTHYETLGVSPNSTQEEIKLAYRKLSLETHPDVSSSQCDKRFKQISHAFDVIGNPKKRTIYDLETQQWQRHGAFRKQTTPNHNSHWPPANTPAYHKHVFTENFFRPRNAMIGMVLGMGAVTLFSSLAGALHHEESTTDMVEAWKNPTTGQWETPAPWDKAYRRDNLTLVSKHLVKARKD